MRRSSVSGRLVVYHDGQFWVGVAEQIDGGRLTVARIVFGAEPSDEEILDLVNNRWSELRFTDPVEQDPPSEQPRNPKRRQREVSRELKSAGPSTKAQAALSLQRESMAEQRKAAAREKRAATDQEKFETRQEKRKRKRRGH